MNELPDNIRRSIAFIVAWGIAIAALLLFDKTITVIALTVATAIEILKLGRWMVKS